MLLLARPTPVRVELILGSGKQLCTDHRRDRDGNPLCGWRRCTGVEFAWLSATPTWRTQAGTTRSTARLAEGRLAFVGRIDQHIPQGLVVPDPFASTGANPRVKQAAPDRTNRELVAADPGKDLLHYSSFIEI